jgi:hypothetical protein
VVVEATPWTGAFALLGLAPLAAVLVLRPLVGDEDARLAERERRLSELRPVEATP